MGVGIQREGGVGVAQDTGQGFGVHTAGEGMGCECMPQIMKAHPLTARVVQQPVQPLAHHRGQQR